MEHWNAGRIEMINVKIQRSRKQGMIEGWGNSRIESLFISKEMRRSTNLNDPTSKSLKEKKCF